MPYQETMVTFGPWAPDDDRNIKPGYPTFWVNGSPVPLQDAKNVIFTGGSYRPFLPPIASGVALPVVPVDAHMTYRNSTDNICAGSGAALYWSNNGAFTWTLAGSGYRGTGWVFAEYGNCVYATNGVDPIQTLDTTGPATFSALASATAPVAFALGVIRDFLVAGNIVSGDQTGSFVIQWSGLAAPAEWDLPNTQQARANQSGAQTLYSQYGAVQYIAQGEEMGMVFQERGITRVQYIGGDVVFSFYTFERKRGLAAPRAAVQVDNTVYFLAADGFYATNGSEVEPIGYGKVNRFFLADCTNIQAVRAAVDTTTQCVTWAYPNASGWGQVIYNYVEKQWTRGTYATPLLFQGMVGQTYLPFTFDVSNYYNRFIGTLTDCELTTKDFRFDPSHHMLVVALRLLTDDANATAGIAARDQDSDPQNFVGYGAPETVSRQISVRADGYMHAVNAKMTAAFTYCQGVGIKYQLRGRR